MRASGAYVKNLFPYGGQGRVDTSVEEKVGKSEEEEEEGEEREEQRQKREDDDDEEEREEEWEGEEEEGREGEQQQEVGQRAFERGGGGEAGWRVEAAVGALLGSHWRFSAVSRFPAVSQFPAVSRIRIVLGS